MSGVCWIFQSRLEQIDMVDIELSDDQRRPVSWYCSQMTTFCFEREGFFAPWIPPLTTWWTNYYLPVVFYPKYPGKDVAVVILDSSMRHSWTSPLDVPMFYLATGEGNGLDPDDRFFGRSGLVANIEGKLRFSLRTSLNSAEAERRPDLLLPGDFPWEGAGEHRNYKGGASGVSQEGDWRTFCDVVDAMIALKTTIAKEALKLQRRAKDPGVDPSWRYMEGSGLILPEDWAQVALGVEF